MQHTIRFFRDLQAVNPPKAAAARVVRQVESARVAMLTTLVSGQHKLLPLSLRLGISESHLSRVVNGHRPIADWFVPAFCWATGCNLLSQFLDLQAAMAEPSERATAVRLAIELMREAA